MPKLTELLWVQEEPRNAGDWHFMLPHLLELAKSAPKSVKIDYIGRAEAASPATGFYQTHNLEQQQIVEEAILRGTTNGR